jgi:site-specific DNA-methyltransferase (adenine-specific)
MKTDVRLRSFEMTQAFNLDCMEGMKQWPDKYFELAIVDPPYGINIGKNGKAGGDKPFGSNTKSFRHGIGLGVVESKCYKPFDDSDIPTKEYFKELKRVSVDQIIWGGNYFIQHLYNTSCFIVWDKIKSGYFADCELAWTSFTTATRMFKYRWNGMLQQDMKNKEIRQHPTQKPVALYKPGDSRFPPFLGCAPHPFLKMEISKMEII